MCIASILTERTAVGQDVAVSRPRARRAADLSSSLPRRMFAEFLGTGLLVALVIGSGIAAQQLSPGDVGIELFENSTATAFGLATFILMFGPVSGAHFNPVISLADWALGRRSRTGLGLSEVGAYVVAQVAGGICGALLADVMFAVEVHISTKHRASGGHLIGEVVATAGLVILIFALARTHRGALAAPAVGAYIGAAYWFTSSTSFANPAVAIGRMFTDTFAGIDPASAGGFIGMQLIGGAVGVVLVLVFYPDISAVADEVVIPHHG
ncbi:MAG: aquaporin family protein [Mycobacterium sp.]|nr:aquaporin family protein [Mycobacterium sp.]